MNNITVQLNGILNEFYEIIFEHGNIRMCYIHISAMAAVSTVVERLSLVVISVAVVNSMAVMHCCGLHSCWLVVLHLSRPLIDQSIKCIGQSAHPSAAPSLTAAINKRK